MQLGLYPHVEFMRSSHFGRHKSRIDWQDLVTDFLQHYIHRYTLKTVNRWRFETWNEPDLEQYNTMNWNQPEEYLKHLAAVRRGFQEISRRYPNFQGELRGPAGTFKSVGKHSFCYGALAQCQKNGTSCPFDILTLHRKGMGKAKQILKGEIKLLKELETDYPFLKTRLWSNSEADPSTGWAIPLDENKGIDYAREVISNVFYHWTALNRGHSGRRLESISQDNAFLSYHPFEFSQRTMLARFQMNLSQPQIYSEYVQKPVFASLGFLANLGSRADLVRRKSGLTILMTTSRSESYHAILMLGAKNAKPKLNVNFTGFDTKKSFGVLVEVLENDRKDPHGVWKKNGSPAYPSWDLLEKMRRAQSPKVFYAGPMGSYLKIQGNFKTPYIISVRLCDKRTVDKWTFGNVSFHMVTNNSVLIRWSVEQRSFNCLKGFQVFFRPEGDANNVVRKWQDVSHGYHVPWHSFQFQSNETVYGDYKLRPIEIFSNRHSERFSRVFRWRTPDGSRD